MTAPSGVIKMIGTADDDESPATQAYYVLMADGNLYTLGNNSARQLGDWTTTTRLNWVQPRYANGGAVMDNIHWISPQETDGQYAGVNVLTKDSTLWAFGISEDGMIGRGTGSNSFTNPGIPNGISASDKVTSVHTGGHTTMLTEKCRTFFGYVGHKVRGSMADGTTTDAYLNTYTFATAAVPICGTTAPEIIIETQITGPNGKFCVGTRSNVSVSPEGGTLKASDTSMVSITGNSATGYQVLFKDTGAVMFTYLYSPQGCNNITDSANVQVQAEFCQLTYPDINITYVHKPVSGFVATNDKMPFGANYLNPVLTSSPSGSLETIVTDTNGNYTFTGSKPGVYVYEIEVCEPWALSPCPIEKLTITVLDASAVTNPPVANIDLAITEQGVPVVLQTIMNDATGLELANLNASSVAILAGSAPNPSTEGSLSVNSSTGDITFTPVSTFTGSVTYQYRVCDDQVPALCDTSTQQITIYPSGSENLVLGVDDYAFTPPATPVSGNVTDNDVDPEGDEISVAPQDIDVPGTGTLILNTDGSFVFTPIQGFSGPVNFPYTLCDDGIPQACAQATLYILVEPENRVIPVVDYNTTFVNQAIGGNIRTNDVDPEGDYIWVSQIASTATGSGTVSASTAQGGTLQIDSLGQYTYTPSLDFTGIDSIAYTLCDSGIPQACQTSILYLTVNAIPELWNPAGNSTLANPDKGISYGAPVKLDLMANDQDVQGHQQILSGVLNPNTNTLVSNGTINNIPGIDEDGQSVANAGSLLVNPDGTVLFTPSIGFKGSIQTLIYSVCDTVASPNTACDTTTIDIRVLPLVPGVDQPPYAGDDYAVARFLNTPTTGNWLRNDTDPNVSGLNDRIQVNGKAAVLNPDVPTGTGAPIDTMTTKEGGILVLNDDGTFVYTPANNFIGSDEVVYEICDTVSPVQCNKATIYLLSYGIKIDFSDLLGADTIGAQYIDFNGDGLPDGAGALWLGESITGEVIPSTNFNASSDAGDDGLIIPGVLDSTQINTYRAIVSSNSAGVNAFVRLMIDWNNDGVFDSTYNVSQTTTSSGSDTVAFSVDLPVGLGAATINYRLLVSSSLADLDQMLMLNGEVEDYQVAHATPVPVTLLSLEARWEDSEATVFWSTATEVNNSHFEVLRSFDAQHYESIGLVESKAEYGNSNEILHYSFVDLEARHVIQNKVYYKLIQHDFNGDYEVFGPVVLNTNYEATDVRVYPNPAKNVLHYEFNEGVLGATDITIQSALGQVVYQKSVHTSIGAIRDSIDIQDLNQGIYYLTISQLGKDAKVFKILKID